MNDIISEDINNLIVFLYSQYESKYSLEFLKC